MTSAVVQQPLMTGTHASGEITAGTSNTQPQPTVKRWTESYNSSINSLDRDDCFCQLLNVDSTEFEI